MAHLEGGREVHDRGLLLDRLDDLAAAVPGVDAPQAGGAVQHLAVVVGVVEHALRAGEHARRGLERAVGREGHPEGVEVVRAADLVHGGADRALAASAQAWHGPRRSSFGRVAMADGRLFIGTRRYSSWSLRGWLAVRLAGLDVEDVVIPLEGGGRGRGGAGDAERDWCRTWSIAGCGSGRALAICEYCAESSRRCGRRTWRRGRGARSIVGGDACRVPRAAAGDADGAGRGRPGWGGRRRRWRTSRGSRRCGATRGAHGAGGPFLFGAGFGAADAMFAPVVARFLTYRPELSAGAAAYCEAVRAHPLMARGTRWRRRSRSPGGWRTTRPPGDHAGPCRAGGAGPRGAARRVRALGFTLTPLARQSGRLRADGPVVPWGTANRCAMLRRRLPGAARARSTRGAADGLHAFTGRYAGLHILALGIEDEAATLARLRRAGLDIPGVHARWSGRWTRRTRTDRRRGSRACRCRMRRRGRCS